MRGLTRGGAVVGWADFHLHVTANLRAGGMVISGEPFDRFGIVRVGPLRAHPGPADAAHQRGGRRAVASLFRGAQAYVSMWRRTGARV